MTRIDTRQIIPQAQSTQEGKAGAAADQKEIDRFTKIKEVAKDFESVFLGIVLKNMRNTVSKSGFIDGGNGEKMYQSMLDSEYAKIMAKQDHSGLADMIAKQLMSQQDVDKSARMIKGIQGQQVYDQQVKMKNTLK